jgi:predicted aminopeptidase
VTLWLSNDSAALARYRAEQGREASFIALLRDYSQRLASAYAAAVSDTQKRADKAALFAQLHAAYLELKAQWAGDEAYDAWMNTDLNNAKLASLAAYHDEVDNFLGLLARCEQNFVRFYGVAEQLGKLPPARRMQCLHELGGSAQPGADCAALLR